MLRIRILNIDDYFSKEYQIRPKQIYNVEKISYNLGELENKKGYLIYTRNGKSFTIYPEQCEEV